MIFNALVHHYLIFLLVDIDPSSVFISRCDPKNVGEFAYTFGAKVNRQQVGEIASYIVNSSEHLFGRIVVTAGRLWPFVTIWVCY